MSAKVFAVLLAVAYQFFVQAQGAAVGPPHHVQQQFRSTDCAQPHTWGPINCHAYIEIYHWNNTAKKCEKSVYGGCRATANNFKNLQACENAARQLCT